MREKKVFTKITQICMVTSDIQKMIKNYEEKLGIGPFQIVVDGERGIGDPAENLTVYGKRQDFKVIVASCQLGEVEIELVQPLDDLSIYSDHLKKHGEGVINHISFVTEDENKSFRKVMMEEGVVSIMTGDTDLEKGQSFEYFDSGEFMGTIVELHDGMKDL